MGDEQQSNGNLGPADLLQMGMSYGPSRILSAGVQLDLFSHIAAGRHTRPDIARAAAASERGVSMLLDALTALGLLKKSGERVALLGNIVHSEGVQSSRDLFGRLQRALRPKGRVVVIDMIPNDDRSGPPYPLIFALNMLVNTEAGGTYTLAEYKEWLTEAGFQRVETADIGSHSPIIIGSRK